MKMRAKNLVQSWLEVELHFNDKTLTEALKGLNNHLGSAHTHSRVREWEENRNGRGERLPRKVRLYMTRVVLKNVLGAAQLGVDKLSKKTVEQICDRLC